MSTTYDRLRAAADLADMYARMIDHRKDHATILRNDAKALRADADRLEAVEREMRECEWKHAYGWAGRIRGEGK